MSVDQIQRLALMLAKVEPRAGGRLYCLAHHLAEDLRAEAAAPE